METEIKRKVNVGKAWYGKLLGYWRTAPFPFRWNAGLEVSELVDIIEEQEKVIKLTPAGIITKDTIPTEVTNVKDWTTTKTWVGRRIME